MSVYNDYIVESLFFFFCFLGFGGFLTETWLFLSFCFSFSSAG